MKIYIVADGEYSDYHIKAVFTDKKNAEKFAALHECSYVSEWEADVHQTKGDVPVYATHRFFVASGYVHFDEKYFSKTKFSTVRKGSLGVEVYVSLDEFDEEKAEKIAQDMYAEWKFEQVEKGR